MDIREIFQDVRVVASGSSHTVTPPPVDTDVDYFMASGNPEVVDRLKTLGFTTCMTDDYEHNFISYRFGKVNVILVRAENLDAIELATKLCTKLNLTNKEDRLTVFRTVAPHTQYRTPR